MDHIIELTEEQANALDEAIREAAAAQGKDTTDIKFAFVLDDDGKLLSFMVDGGGETN